MSNQGDSKTHQKNGILCLTSPYVKSEACIGSVLFLTMINFLQETICDIKKSGYTVNDIMFIGSPQTGHSCTWDEFTILANKEYNSGFGAQIGCM